MEYNNQYICIKIKEKTTHVVRYGPRPPALLTLFTGIQNKYILWANLVANMPTGTKLYICSEYKNMLITAAKLNRSFNWVCPDLETNYTLTNIHGTITHYFNCLWTKFYIQQFAEDDKFSWNAITNRIQTYPAQISMLNKRLHSLFLRNGFVFFCNILSLQYSALKWNYHKYE